MDNTQVVQTANTPDGPIPPSPPSGNYLKFIIAGVVILFFGLFGGYYLIKSSSKPTMKACTKEAKLCPDGSSVGRAGPNCEFAPCTQITNIQPSTTLDPTADWKIFIGKVNNLSFKYPGNYFPPEEINNYVSLVSPSNPSPRGGDPYGVDNTELKIEVYFSDSKPGDDLESYVKETDEITANDLGTKVLETKSVVIDNTKAVRHKVKGIGASYSFFLLKNGKRIQIIKYPAETIRDKEFDQILSTFKFL